MDKLKRPGLMIALCILHCMAFAQNVTDSTNHSTDFMRSNGKIYVVVAVVVVIVLGIFIYLLSLDRKITKLEKGQ
jgi:CcmD family protein